MSTLREENRLWQQIKQLQYIPKENRNEYNYRTPLLTLIEKVFVTDLQFAFEQHADLLYFNVLREQIDLFKKQTPMKSNERMLKTQMYTAIYESLGELANLSVVVQDKYGFAINDVPMISSMCPHAIRLPSSSSSAPTSDPVNSSPPPRLSPLLIARFSHFICIRMGDLFRYLGDTQMARELYTCAFRANPDDGQSCNQVLTATIIALVESIEKHYLEALYYHVLAMNARESFTPASANIEQIFNKFASINIEDDNNDYDSVFLKVIGRCHSLSSLDKNVFERMHESLRDSKRKIDYSTKLRMYFVILVSVWYQLGVSQDEVKCSNYIVNIITDHFSFLLQLSLMEDQATEIKQQLLSTLWIHVSWIETKKISLVNRIADDLKWIRNLACLIDDYDPNLTLKCENIHFVPLSFLDYERASVESLVSRLTIILLRTLKSYRISDLPNEHFTAFIDAHSSSFAERRRQRVSRTAAVLSSI
ncbi:unnamed protein product [Anisakis simplex]|uniref:EST1_DNA_bind domain-containing protein n=1 Tax=Anisakis simplex TaxID=6269 RepID=A0A0M3JXD4_ANISI|nr:unnamed protein product [Anisakis simplex]